MTDEEVRDWLEYQKAKGFSFAGIDGSNDKLLVWIIEKLLKEDKN